MMKNRFCLPLAVAILLCAIQFASAQWTTTNIVYAKRDVAPQDYFADDIGAYYEVRGRVTSPHFSTNRTEFFIQDTNDNVGIHVYASSFVADAGMYTEVNVLGALAQSNGLRMLLCLYPEDVTVTDPTPADVAPVPGTIADFLSNGELYEGTYVVISNLTLTDPANWPDWKDNANLSVTDLTGRITVRIDADLDIDGQLAPTNVFHLRGIFSQFDSTLNPTGGYQILPRAYTDFELATDNEPPEIFIVNSNAFSVVAGSTLTVNMLAHDRNAEDVLVISTNDAPDGSVVTNLPNREARFTWTPDGSYAGTTNKVVLEITDGLLTNTTAIDVFVLSDELGNIRLNEVHWDPAPGLAGDANADGVKDAMNQQDEFVEIVNDNATDVNITGWQIKFGTNVLYTFLDTILTGKTAVVVFGGGTPVGAFGHSIVYACSPTWGALINAPAGRTVSLWTDSGAQVFSYDYSPFGTPDMSATRNPDFTGDFVLHTGVVSFLRWSPGTMGSGKYFAGTGLTNAPPIIQPIENRSAWTGQGLVIPIGAIDPESNPITLSVSNTPASASFMDNGDGTGTLVYTGLVSDANSNFIVSVYASDGIAPASFRTFTLSVLDGTYTGLIINEYLVAPSALFDANNDGGVNTSQDEYIEIVNNTTGAINLAGCMIYDSFTKRHVFSSVVVPTGGAIVVFGGGSLANFQYPPAQLATDGLLGLNNDSDTIILYSPQTNEIARAVYAAGEWSPDASQTRFPDVVGGWTNHYLATETALRGSPGRRADGSRFVTNQPPVFIDIANKSVTASHTLSFEVRVIETDGDVVSLTASNLPGTAQFFPTNASGGAAGTFLWTSAGPVGVYTTLFYAVDKDAVVSTSLVITVSPESGGEYPGIVWINEIHYDNTGGDVDEGVEIAGPAGTDLTGYSLYVYNGNGGGAYSPTTTLSGVISDEGCGYGALWFAIVGLQNGASDAVALVYNSDTSVIQFLSYEGPLMAANGPAAGMTSIDIGVFEAGTEAVGRSLQLQGSGTNYDQFVWAPPTNLASRGLLNIGQDIFPCGGGLVDTDGDGISDDYENTWFGGPTNAIAGNDDDDDGFSNLDEYIADTIPVNPLGSNSFFEIERLTNSSARFIQFLSSTGRLYTFQTTADLQNGNSWSNLEEDVQGEGGTMRFDDPAIAPRRHYRLRVRVP